MKLVSRILAIAVLMAIPAVAQSAPTLKKQLKDKETAAGENVEQMIDVAEWAKEQGLVRDRRRILQKVLEIDPDNARANELLGFVSHDGKWVTKSEAEKLHREALEAEMKAKGFVQVDGVWVSADEKDDAKKGIFWHDGERVSRADKTALTEGKVRHPRTGEFIAPDDLAKAEQGMFPVANGTWADEAAADQYHAATEHPWVVRTYYGTLITTRSLAETEKMKTDFDGGFESAKRVFMGIEPSPALRPIVLVAGDADTYRQLGEQIGAEGSAYSVFQAEAEVMMGGQSVGRPVVSNWQEGWGPYWLRHAAGLAYAYNVAAEAGVELPLWFARGVGGYSERLYNDHAAGHFGKQHLQKGGVKDLGPFFADYQISGDVDGPILDFNVYQAGLLIAFCMDGGDQESTDAMMAVTTAMREKDSRAFGKAMAKLVETLSGKSDQVREYLRKVTQKV